MTVCIHFVFGALCCYAYLLWRLKPSTLKKKWKRIRSGNNGIHSSDDEMLEEQEEEEEERRRKSRSKRRVPGPVHSRRKEGDTAVEEEEEEDRGESFSAVFSWKGRYALAVCIYCLLYTSPSPRDRQKSRMPSSA